MEMLMFEHYINSTTRSSKFNSEVYMLYGLNKRLTIGQFIGKSKSNVKTCCLNADLARVSS
jgi:hypothetical protein